MGHSATLSAETGPYGTAVVGRRPPAEDVSLNSPPRPGSVPDECRKTGVSHCEHRLARSRGSARCRAGCDAAAGAALRQPARTEWMPLFYRILQNRIRDSQRRKSVRNRLFAWWPAGAENDESAEHPGIDAPDGRPEPDALVANGEALRELESAVAELPARQSELSAPDHRGPGCRCDGGGDGLFGRQREERIIRGPCIRCVPVWEKPGEYS